MEPAEKRAAYVCVNPGCQGYRYIDLAKAKGETKCKWCSTPFSASATRLGPPMGGRRAGGKGGREVARAPRPQGGGRAGAGGGAGDQPKPVGRLVFNQLQGGNTEPRPQGQGRRQGSAEDAEVSRCRKGLDFMEDFFGKESAQAKEGRRMLEAAETAAQERMSPTQKLSLLRSEHEAACQDLSRSFARVKEIGAEKLKLQEELERVTEKAGEQKQAIDAVQKKIWDMEAQMHLQMPVKSGGQVDTSAAGQLYRLGQAMEKVFRDSMRNQNQRELTAAEERSMQEQIYGTTSALSHPFAPEVPSDSENAMDDEEVGPAEKKGRRSRTLQDEEGRIAREGFDPHQDSDMESDDSWSQVGPDREVQKLRRRIKMGKEAAEKFLQPQRMVKPGRGRGKRSDTPPATGGGSGSGGVWDAPHIPGSHQQEARIGSREGFPPLTTKRSAPQAGQQGTASPGTPVAEEKGGTERHGAGPVSAGTPREPPTGSLTGPPSEAAAAVPPAGQENGGGGA